MRGNSIKQYFSGEWQAGQELNTQTNSSYVKIIDSEKASEKYTNYAFFPQQVTSKHSETSITLLFLIEDRKHYILQRSILHDGSTIIFNLSCK